MWAGAGFRNLKEVREHSQAKDADMGLRACLRDNEETGSDGETEQDGGIIGKDQTGSPRPGQGFGVYPV